jgi:hypothetical protein
MNNDTNDLRRLVKNGNAILKPILVEPAVNLNGIKLIQNTG